MKKQNHFLLSAIAALVISLSTAAQAKETARHIAGRKAIAAAYAKIDQATLKKDIKTLMSFIAPDFQAYLRNGTTLDYQAYSVATRYGFANPYVRIIKTKSKIKSITWRGRDAIVILEGTSVLSVRTNEKPIRIEATGLSRDYWSPSQRGWQIRQYVQRTGKSWLNGQLIEEQQ